MEYYDLDSIDITTLERNGFNQIYIDGYDVYVKVIKAREKRK